MTSKQSRYGHNIDYFHGPKNDPYGAQRGFGAQSVKNVDIWPDEGNFSSNNLAITSLFLKP